MEWAVTNNELLSTFSSLSTRNGDKFEPNVDCKDHLERILHKLLTEDCVLRTYRRAIGLSQGIKKDIIPLMCVVQDKKIFDLIIKILGNLTVPVECLMDIDVFLKTDHGRSLIFDLNWVLTTCKEAFIDARATRCLIDYMKPLLDKEEEISKEDCEIINNCLLLLRNILHIPEVRGGVQDRNGTTHQNQLIWNMFTQSFDKVLIQLMIGQHRAYWSMSVVQLIALIYKDQHVVILQKLLNFWFEASLSESSEDNESNTSPPDQISNDSSSSMMTSDPTSDSSDNGGSSEQDRKRSPMSSEGDSGMGSSSSASAGARNSSGNSSSGNSSAESSSGNNSSGPNSPGASSSAANTPGSNKNSADTTQNQNHNVSRMSETGRKSFSMSRKHFLNVKSQEKKDKGDTSERGGHSDTKYHSTQRSWTNNNDSSASGGNSGSSSKKGSNSPMSDCGYGTQPENQGSISTSSNEDESQNTNSKPVHQKPANLIHKPRYDVAKVQAPVSQEKKEWRRKKLIKRSKTNIMYMKAVLHHTPCDEDISNLLKEFTVDFLLKGYSCLVQQLQTQLLTYPHAHIDTSHFFWLITYFLKFASQLELDMEHVCPVLSYETVSYLTFEGVNLCEQLEILKQQQQTNLSPCLRRMHLVVTALREVIQTVEVYKKFVHLGEEDLKHLEHLQEQISSTEELKYLFLLLLRYFDPTLQSKQYLQDLIVTNHNLIIFLEKGNSSAKPANRTSIYNHIKLFANNEIMKQYGLLLEYFEENGEFVNNCIFTMMHHVAGDINQADTLFQPTILKTFFKIWESDFQVCDDWSDLIEFVVHKFINLKHKLPVPLPDGQKKQGDTLSSGWSEDDFMNLHKYYMSSAYSSDRIGEVVNCFTESGVLNKTRAGVIEQLLKQDVISGMEFGELIKKEPDFDTDKSSDSSKINKNYSSKSNESLNEINFLRDHLLNENKENGIIWLKRCLLDACHAKLSLTHDLKNVEPVPYYYALLQQSIPLVPWTEEQRNILTYQPFVLLLDKLGLHLPSDTGKIFVRIPNFWTSDIMYSTAQKLGPMNLDDLKFDPKLLEESNESSDDSDSEATECDTPTTAYQMKQSPTFIGFTPEPDLKSNWMEIVMISKATPRLSIDTSTTIENETLSAFSEPIVSGCSEEADLAEMCVSDEDNAIASV